MVIQNLTASLSKVKQGAVNFEAIRNIAAQQVEPLVKAWLPDGRREGDEWVARNPTRADDRPGSFKINIRTGAWADFATDDKGGDLISLYAYLHGVSQVEAARKIADELGIELSAAPSGLTLETYAAAKRLPVDFLRKLGLETIADPWGKQRDVLAIPYRKRDGSLHRNRLRVALDKLGDGAPRMFWDKREDKIGACLYGLDTLPTKGCPVFLVEGESDAQTLWHHGFDAVAVPGAGSYAPGRDDAELDGLDIIAFIEPDQGGEALIKQLGKSRHASHIKLARLDGFKDVSEVHCQAPERFDDIVKAAIAAVRPLTDVLKERERRRPKLPDGFRYIKDGSVEYLSSRKDENGEDIWVWLCSPIEVLAETRGQDEKGWGLLIRVQTPDGVWHEQAVTRSLFSTASEDLIAMLADLGVKFAPTTSVKGKLRAALALSKPKERARTATRVGWYGAGNFVLPDEAFGERRAEPIVFQPERPIAHAYKVAGTLEGWQDEIGARAIGNSRLVFAASAAFAGPFLQPLNIEGGGFHLRGDGSTGKTSSLWVAGSIWGGGALSKGFLNSWRTTDNALESRAVLHSDTLLLLDELGQVSGQVAAKTIYMLANGQGKARAAQSGEGKPPAEFRVLFLSTGEVSLNAKLGEDGLTAMAGQETRFIDLDADAGAGMGAFEHIHDCATPADFSDTITNACAEHYGHPAREFLRRLMDTPEETFTEVRALMSEFPSPEHATGQVRRVAKRFALVAAAGEIATRFGILPWPEGTAMTTAGRLFQEWLERRGSTSALESVKAITQVRAIIERHGSSRFVPWEAPSTPVVNRLGYVRREEGTTTFYVLPQMFRDEVCKGLDAARVARELVAIGVLSLDNQRKTSTLVKLPGVGPTRCYVIDAGKLFAGD